MPMPSIDRGLDLLLGKLEELARDPDPHRRAAYKAVLPLMEDWLAPSAYTASLATRIEQDLANIGREIDAIRDAYRAAVDTNAGQRRAG
jgi:hypothetical protein